MNEYKYSLCCGYLVEEKEGKYECGNCKELSEEFRLNETMEVFYLKKILAKQQEILEAIKSLT